MSTNANATADEHERTVGTNAEPEVAVAMGTRLGRYMLLEEIGRGGMGVVVAAYDRELDRKVALKLLKPAHGPDGRSRMHREAQALAKLQHPNVVSVFEVDEVDARVFVAMEYIEGVTFDQWRRNGQRSWLETLDIAVRAGRGLAAAHAAGIIHRDFKPGNVLVGDDGRVRVVDFGIAIAAAVPSDDGDSDDDSDDVIQPLDVSAEWAGSLTETGEVLGTPAFMAPEQHAKRRVDAQSDQFAFCVTLYRMLYGTPPFTGKTVRDLRRAIVRGEVATPPTDSDVPPWLKRAVLRGLEVERKRRWPSMDALLDALTRRTSSQRGPLLVVSAAVVMSIGAWLLVDTPDGALPCDDAVGEAVWSPTRKQAVSAAFDATDLPYAKASFELAEARLDAYAQALTAASSAVCEDSRGAPSKAHDLQRSCLARRKAELDALVEVLEAADASVVSRATDASATMSPVSHCEDIAALESGVALPPPDVAVAVAEARDVIARADALNAAGRFDQALAVAEQAVELATATGYDPVKVEAIHRFGTARFELGDLEAGAEILSDNALQAIAARYDEFAARSASKVSFLLGYRLARHAEGMVWARHAAAAVKRYGQGTLVEAEHLITLGGIESSRGEYEAATAAFARALEIQLDKLGPDHPMLGGVENNLGSMLVYAGDYVGARSHVERALRIFAAAYGPDHPRVGTALNGLGVIQERMGDLAAARETHARALRIRERAFGESSSEAAVSMDNLGSVLLLLGEVDQAEQYCRRALDVREATLGSDHPHVASALVNLGLIAEKTAKYDEAIRNHERAIRIFESALGADHPFVAHPLTSLGRAELALDRPAAAVVALRRALALRVPTGTPAEVGETRFALARALWANDDRSTAVDEATKAVGEVEAAERDAVQSWLTAHVQPSEPAMAAD